MRGSSTLGLMLLIAAFAADAEATTIALQPSSQDAFVQQDKPNRISSGKVENQRLRVQSSSAAVPRLRRSLVQFNLSGIPGGATINSAVLALHEANNAGSARVHGVHRVSNGWLQSTVKWNNQPNAAGVATDTVDVGTSRGTRSFDVKDDVQTFVNVPTLNHGWAIKDQTEIVTGPGANIEVTYNSRAENHIPDLPDRPKLTIDFTAPPCQVDADCADVNACTISEHCQDGFCAVTARECDDGNLCTDDICDPTLGCRNVLGECNDGFECTADSCNPETGNCSHTPMAAVCTGPCGTGNCIADPDRSDIDPTTGCFSLTTAPAGTTCGSDGNPCTNDVCDGSGHCGVTNTASCSDGDACTTGDQCADGQCRSGNSTVCAPLDACHLTGVCNPASGCSNPPAAAGIACSDDNACTQTDTCNGAGTCIASNPVICAALDACHDAGACDSGTGVCSNPPKEAGSSCNDDDACTQSDACDGSGACVGANPVTCLALDDCHHTGTCDSDTGVCSNPLKDAGASCIDGNGCTQTDVCNGAGLCVGSNPVTCTAIDDCHEAGTCNPGTGDCSTPVKGAGAACSDADACTQTDQCNGAGTCTGGNPVVCTALDQCHQAGNCNPATGQCSNPTLPNGTTCSDANACTLTDACNNGACVSGISAMCGDSATQPACGEECDEGGISGTDCNTACQFICGPAPATGCRHSIAPRKGQLIFGDNPKDARDRVQWSWMKGSATAKADFGAPLTDTSYTLCIYDGSASEQPVLRAQVPPGGRCGKKPCWKSMKTGFAYRNRLHTPEGISSLVLKAGVAGKARVSVAGKGLELMMPTLPALSSPVTAQILNSNGECWQTVFSAPFKKQKVKLFRDVAD